MQSNQNPEPLERILTTIRWFSLIGLILLNSVFPGITSPTFANIIFLLFGLWLVLLNGLSILGKYFPNQTIITISVDLLFSLLIFHADGAYSGAMLVAGFLPIITSGLNYGFKGSLILVFPIILIHAASGFVFQPIEEYWIDFFIEVIILFIFAFLTGYFGKQLVIQLKFQEFFKTSKKQEQERKIQERVFALDNLTSMIYSSLNFERLLDISLDMSMKALSNPEDELSPLVSAFFLIENEKFIVGSARRFTQADVRIALDGTSGAIHHAITSGEMTISNEVGSDPELSKIMALMNCNSVCISPLVSGYDVFGALLFAHPDESFFTGFQKTIIEVVTRLVKVAIDNARLYANLEEEKKRMIDLQDETQKKLARDLHDGPTQTVAAIAMRVNFTRRLIERDMIQEAAEELFKIEDLSRRSTKEIRHMLFTLRPLILESNGLIAALLSLAEKMSETYDQNVFVEAEERTIEQLELNKQGILFYIIEEAVNNARKHAEASAIRVRISPPKKDIILVEVIDNGVGFNVGAIDKNYENRGSLGMVNLRERSELLNGLFRIESEEGEGTRVKVWVPLTEDAKDILRQKL